MADTINDVIQKTALDGVARVSVDGLSIEALPIDQQILAAEYAAKQTAASRNHMGLRFRKVSFGGIG